MGGGYDKHPPTVHNGNSRGVGATTSTPYNVQRKFQGGGGSKVNVPSWGYGYFLELHNNTYGQCKTQTVDCRLRTRGKMQTECKMQTAD